MKFDVADVDVKLKPYQFYNHFADNRELTTKAGLCKNLWTNSSDQSILQISSFFPRCYDLSDAKQAEHFVNDFNQTAIFSVIKMYATELIKDVQVSVLYNEYKRRKEFAHSAIYEANIVK